VAVTLTGSDMFAILAPMATALDQVTKDALNLPTRQKLALAELLIESVDSTADPEAEGAWESEIEARIRAIDEGKVAGIPFAEVMRVAEQRLIT
jgi:putative addiction module component (TIGR02574 family)